MGDDSEKHAKAVLKSMKHASETVRKAVATSLPVASNQVMTVSLPGTIIDWKEYYYNVSRHIRPPLDVQVKEARLVDGMIPLSKFMAGKTGKSVARSYLAALDLLLPVEASVSGAVANDTEVTDPRLKTIRDRYNTSMAYLISKDDTESGAGKTKVDTYVVKQAAWAKEVAAYTQAQAQALERFSPPAGATTAQIKQAQEKYLQWIQEHAQNFKSSIQSKYMDWVVHGYKFMVDFHFGVVDISSGMKRIENSKEAYRNLTIIATDGSSEYNGVVLSPASWATIVAKKVLNWQKRNSKPNPAEIRAEIRRLENLKASHEVLRSAIKDKAFFPVMSNAGNADHKALKAAYADVYTDLDQKNAITFKGTAVEPKSREQFYKGYGAPDPTTNVEWKNFDALKRLQNAQQADAETSLSKTTNAARKVVADTETTCDTWLANRLSQLDRDIKALNDQLEKAPAPSAIPLLQVVNSEGVIINADELKADPNVQNPPEAPVIDLDDEETWRNKVDGGPDPWTKISCKVSAKSDLKEAETSESASAFAAKAGWGLFKTSTGASHSDSASKAMQKMSNLDVEVSMSCMVVEIERPWLHAELFFDAELDSGKFDISPGEEELKRFYDEDKNVEGKYQQFSSYPSAFVVASDIELTFSGDTTQLESAVSASRTAANLSVGYGPFALSGSHSSSKTKSRTKMESTATGCRISVEAPQIVGWVQTLLPRLPKLIGGTSAMAAPLR